MSKKQVCIIALGANLGSPESAFMLALVFLEAEVGKVLKRSSWISTEPLSSYAQDQPPYLNGVVLVETDLGPEELLRTLQHIERSLGRKREKEDVRWGPRVIDLDLIAWADLVLDTPDLTLPHPEMHKREFVLRPLLEILPDWRHPISGLSVSEMLEKL